MKYYLQYTYGDGQLIKMNFNYMKFETKYNIGDRVTFKKDNISTGKIILISILYDGYPSSDDVSYLVKVDELNSDNLIRVSECNILECLKDE